MDSLPSSCVVPWFLRVAAFAGILALGCTKSASGPTTTTGPAALTTITVSPSSDTLVVFATQLFTAVGKDGAGNVLALTPTWSMGSGGGTISDAGVFTAGSTAGTSVVLARSGSIAGSATVVVAAATTPPGTLASITVTPNPATLFDLGTQQFTATGKDGAGNIVAFTPTWSVVNGGGTINGSGVFVAATTTGTFPNTVKAASGGISGFASLTVNPTGNGTQFVFLNLPKTIPAGPVITPALQVAAEDGLGNVAASFNGPVTVYIRDAYYGQAGGTTTVTAVNGVATFSNLSISRPGGLLVFFIATTPDPAGPIGESAMFDTPAGTPSKLAFVIQPSYSPGYPCPSVNPVEAQVQDSAGNAVVTYPGTITLSLGANPGGGTLTGRLTGHPDNYPGSQSNGPGNALLGAPPINLRIDQPGNGYTLVASGPGLASATSAPFNMPTPPTCVAPSLGPAALSFLVGPSAPVAGEVITPPMRVAVVDGYGHVVPGYDGPMTVALFQPNLDALGGTTTVTAVDGVATFADVRAPTHAVGFGGLTATGDGLTGSSTGFSVLPGPAQSLKFFGVGNPPPPHAGLTMGEVDVRVLDAYGNVAYNSIANVTISLYQDPTGMATLTAPSGFTVTTRQGTAAFDNMIISQPGSGFILGAVSPGLGSAMSPLFYVAP